MRHEEQYALSEWGEGYWRWQCLSARRHGCYGILGPPATREDAAAAAAHHRAEVHEGLLIDLSALDGRPRRDTGRSEAPSGGRGRGIAHQLASFAERASDQRRRRD